MANLMATNPSDSDLGLILSAHLDALAVSPQAKQVIIPALLGIAKFTEVHAQARRCVLAILSASAFPSIISAPVLLSRRP